MFWLSVGVAGLIALFLIWTVLGTALACVWGGAFMVMEKRWGFTTAGNLALIPVWAVVVWISWLLGGGLTGTACFAAVIGLVMAMIAPKG